MTSTPTVRPDDERTPMTTDTPLEPREVEDRSRRQVAVHAWCAAAFGADHAASVPQRGVRFLEEAIELYQACGCDPAMAHKLIDYIFAKPADPVERELGGVGLTLLALAQATGHDADACELAEFERVKTKSLEHFHARNATKNEAGFDVTASSPTPRLTEAEVELAARALAKAHHYDPDDVMLLRPLRPV